MTTLKFKPVEVSDDTTGRIPNRPVVDAAVFQMTCQEQREAIADELSTVNADMLRIRDMIAANDARIMALQKENTELQESLLSAKERRADLLELDAIKATEFQGYESQLRRKAGQ